MPTLEELLRTSLKGVNEKFDLASKVLHAAVVETAKAVESVTEGKATLRLNEYDKDEGQSIYQLVVLADGDRRTIATLVVPSSGFPIRRVTEDGVIVESFSSGTALESYFSKLVSEPNSLLVAYLAYLVRNANSPEESIPF